MSVEHSSYKSPLKSFSHPNGDETFYTCSRTKQRLGRVYKTGEGKWYLATRYIGNWQPIEVFTKYKGFLFLNELHRRFTLSKRSG